MFHRWTATGAECSSCLVCGVTVDDKALEDPDYLIVIFDMTPPCPGALEAPRSPHHYVMGLDGWECAYCGYPAYRANEECVRY